MFPDIQRELENIQLSIAIDSLILYQKAVPLGENSCKCITLLMANTVWKILIPQIYVDFHGWENRTSTRKILFNLIQKSKNKNDTEMILQAKLTDPLKKLLIKVINKSELKFFYRQHFFRDTLYFCLACLVTLLS